MRARHRRNSRRSRAGTRIVARASPIVSRPWTSSAAWGSRISRRSIELVAMQAQLWWEDRLRLAEVLARRKAMTEATALIDAGVGAGAARRQSRGAAPTRRARLLLLIIGAAVGATAHRDACGESGASVDRADRRRRLLDHSRTNASLWNTQDLRIHGGRARDVRATAAGRSGARDSCAQRGSHDRGDYFALSGFECLAGRTAHGSTGRSAAAAAHTRAAQGRRDRLLLYHGHEVPKTPPVRPEDTGIQVERWYESYDRPHAHQ